jgi:hypothetical protein
MDRLTALIAIVFVMTVASAEAHQDAAPPPSAAPTPNPSVMAPPSARPPVAPPARLAIPQWKPGMTWTVECDIPDALVAEVPPWVGGRKRRSGPQPQFVFTVERAADVGSMRLFSVVVKAGAADQRTGAELVFGGERGADGRMNSLFLYKAAYRIPTGDGVSVIRRDYNTQAKAPFPVFNDDNAVPSDFPMLSIEMAKHDGSKDGVWKEFQAAELVEADLRSRAVRQTIVFATDKMQFGERTKVNAPRSECVDVFMKLLSGSGQAVRLVFHPAYPWPVYGEGNKGRFWLLP